MPKTRTAVSIRLSLIEKLRDIVGLDPSPVTRLFNAKRRLAHRSVKPGWKSPLGFRAVKWGDSWSKATCLSSSNASNETDRNAFMRGAHSAANFLGAQVEIDAARGVITIHPPAALKDVATGEIDSRPLVEPKIPAFH